MRPGTDTDTALIRKATALDPLRTANDAAEDAAAVWRKGKPTNMAVPADATRAGELRAAMNRTLMLVMYLEFCDRASHHLAYSLSKIPNSLLPTHRAKATVCQKVARLPIPISLRYFKK